MTFRALLVWLLLVVLAIVNAGLRNALIVPRYGKYVGQVASTITFSVVIFAVAWLTIRWIRPAKSRQAAAVGVGWVVLTIAFEFVAGHYLFGSSWEELLGAYNIFRGQVWLLVLLATGLAPIWAARRRGLFGASR